MVMPVACGTLMLTVLRAPDILARHDEGRKYGYGFMCFDYSRNRHVPADRPSRFEEFVASFDGGRDHGFGAWDDLVCFHV